MQPSNDKIELHGDEIFGQKTSLPKYLYVPSINKYLSRDDGCIYSDNDFDFFTKLEKEWKDSLTDYSFSQLIAIFPEAKKIATKKIKDDIKLLKERVVYLAKWKIDWQNNVVNKVHFSQQDIYKEWGNDSYSESLAEVEQKMKKLSFNLSLMDEKKTVSTNSVNESDIAKAKEVPITNFFTGRLHKHNKLAVGKCPFHNEKTGSFTIYLNQNTFYCYGCSAGGTVIDFVMRVQNLDFLSAVKYLIK